MSEEGRFTIELEHLEGYEFKVRFDWGRAPDLLMDEPSPLGEQAGPNAARLLAAAVGNCLSASLLYCMSKTEAPPGSLHTQASCRMVRNDRGRLRVGGIEVRIVIGDKLHDSPRLARCLQLFEDFCVVTGSVSEGIPIEVEVIAASGAPLHQGRVARA
jgi:organic hydroperoxide reductase OsmC/OhrA